MDGIAMAFKKDKARIEHPWREEADAHPVAASAFRDRVFVRSKELRELVKEFAGLSASTTSNGNASLVMVLD